jgi:hypothetical protein
LSHDFDLEHIFPLESTVLVDDLEDWAKDQQDLVVNVKAFEITDPDSETDVELVTVIAQLEAKKNSSSKDEK